MKQHILATLLITILLASSAAMAEPIKISFAPWFGHNYGETEYILDLSGWLPDENGDMILDQFGNPLIARIKSQLEFPLDIAMAGLTARLDPGSDSDFWWFEAGIYTNLNDPGGIMTDGDWQGISGILPFTKYSYTESEAQGSAFRFDIEGGIRVYKPGKMNVYAVVGFRYQKIKQDIIGFDGWFIPFDDATLTFDDQVFTQSGIGIVGKYEVTYKQPQIGLLSSMNLTPNLRASLKTVYTPVWFDDFDDHLLRFKTSIADGTGDGFIGSLRAHYEFAEVGGPARPFLDFNLDYVSISSSGSQTQTWYGDDPASDYDDTGVSVDGIPHEVNSTQYNVGVRLGLTF